MARRRGIQPAPRHAGWGPLRASRSSRRANRSLGGRARTAPAPLVVLLLTVAGAVLAACGSTPQAPAATGSLQVTVAGLPSGAEAAVSVTGPATAPADGPVALTGSAVLDDLAPGAYEVVGESVEVGADTYYPAVPSQSVAVVAGEVAAVSVEYRLQQPGEGGVTFTLTGLPDGVAAQLSLGGPEGYSSSVEVNDTLTVNGLPAGEYGVAGQRVTDLYGYEPVAPSLAFTVTAGGTAQVEVAYEPVTGAIGFEIEGLPAGVPAGVALVGPGGEEVAVDGSTVVRDLAPGAYDYEAPVVTTAADVTTGAIGYAYGPVTRSVFDGEVEPGETDVVTLGYEAVTGSVVLVVRGLPSGAAADVTFTAGGQALHTFTGTGALNNLAPGAYEFAAAGVEHDFTYQPDPASGEALPAAGETVVVEIDYRASEGDLRLRSEGLPAGVRPAVIVGDDPASHYPPKTLRLPTGRYELTATDPVVVAGAEYRLVKGPAFVDVAAGEEVRATFSYAVVGELVVEITGLPSDFDANVVVTGPGGYDSGRITATERLRLLPVGEYQVEARHLGPFYYADDTQQTVQVETGTTAYVTVHYTRPVFEPGNREADRR